MQIPLSQLSSTPKLVQDYLNQKDNLKHLYGLPFSEDNLIKQCKSKSENYTNREVLCSILDKQMKDLELSDSQRKNLEKLNEPNTLTICTGHQLNIFTGPLYFIYKILQAAKTANEMNARQKEYYFVPMYWMASEDHDFEEINHCFLNNEKVSWETNQKGAVGRFSISDFQSTMDRFELSIGDSPYSKEIMGIVKEAYQQNQSLSGATRKIVHLLTKEYGVLILDGDSKQLKNLMIPYFKEELLNERLYKETKPSIEILDKENYKIQVNPREINLFYLQENGRNRIEKRGNLYYIVDTDLQFSEEEIIAELERFPERFSPNALMRPLYQEVILPNVAYIGGNAEIAYWLELKTYFDYSKIDFPILIPRNSIAWANQRWFEKWEKLGLQVDEIMLPLKDLENKVVEKFSNFDLELDKRRMQIEELYDEMIETSKQTDKSLEGLLKAQKQKQLNAFDALEKRVLKAEKRTHQEKIDQLHRLYQQIFPNGTFQERIENVFQYYQYEGTHFLSNIYSTITYDSSVLNIVQL